MRSLSQTSSCSSFASRTTARKRIIYAHSDILTKRSDYFANMLASSFSENLSPAAGERKICTIVVEEADFETIYWLLKFCYANWLLFRDDDDPRIAMDGIGAGWNLKWSSLRGGEWDWKTFQKDDSDARSVASADSRPSAVESQGSTKKRETLQASNPTSVSGSPSAPKSIPSDSRQPPTQSSPPSHSNATTSRRIISGVPSAATPPNNSSSLPRPKSVAAPITTHNFPPPSRQVFPLSPRTGRQHPSSASIPDPHPHPTPAPKPASALSMYQIAHRYAMSGLASLALEHMMSTITPRSCFALLLATSTWEDLHLLVEVCHFVV